MTRRGPLLLLASLMVAGLAAFVANRWLATRAAGKPVAQDQVVTASMDIPLGTRIEERHLSSMALMSGKAPSGTFRQVSEVVGKVAATTLVAGEILMAARMADAGTGSALASVVGENMRAVTVRVDDVVGVAGFLLPGNRVDVIATRKDTMGNKVNSETILSDIKVLAVDQSAAVDSNQPVVVHAVTLEVSPLDAEVLLKGKTAGSIQLTLRNPLDKSDSRTKPEAPVEPVKVVTQRLPVIRKPPAPPGITIIRGTAIATTAHAEQ